jgi:ElaB/YqjD/DUF883 family membrane-anchored ribosome-binding protein
MSASTPKHHETTEADERPLQERAMDAVHGAPDAVRHAASAVAEKAPDAINASQDAIRASHEAIDEASRRIQATPPHELTAWATFGVGLWAGLLLGRAPRLLVLAAGLPALIMAGALMARRDAPKARKG